MRRRPDRWTAIARWLHWTVAAMILVEVPAGLVMSRTYGAKDSGTAWWQLVSSNIHHTLGLIILAVAVVRLGWRAVNPPPAPAASRRPVERELARGTHWLLYALLLLVPLSGWAALSSLADSPVFGHTALWFFGTDGFGPHGVVPRLVPPRPYNDAATPLTYGLFAKSHRLLLVCSGVLLAAHILAALRHHFLLKDSTLRRMWAAGDAKARKNAASASAPPASTPVANGPI